jgi:hypothetical protein
MAELETPMPVPSRRPDLSAPHYIRRPGNGIARHAGAVRLCGSPIELQYGAVTKHRPPLARLRPWRERVKR